MEPVSELSSIQFYLASAEEIKKAAVCEVLFPKTSGTSSLGDERLGALQPMQTCIICNKKPSDVASCAGHFGYIALNEPVIHPLMIRYTLFYLKIFCCMCNRVIFPNVSDYAHLRHLVAGNTYDVCMHCMALQPVYTACVADGTIHCSFHTAAGTAKAKRVITPRELHDRFVNITDEELAKLGNVTHPKNLILTAIPVLPTRARPAIVTEVITCDDDQTIQYMEILKINNHLADKTLSGTKRNKYITMLGFRIKSLFDNTNQKSRHTNNRALKGLKERIAGKTGLIRCNLMGKRVNLSARTVLGPDVSIPTGWMCVPESIAKILTVAETVTDHNKVWLEEIVNSGQANYVIKPNPNSEGEPLRIILKYALVKRGTPLQANDIIVHTSGKKTKVGFSPDKFRAFLGDKVFRDGVDVTAEMTLSEHRKCSLAVGDVVERHMRDKDVLLFNRQPTLHSGSMIGLYTKIMPGNTFRIPLSITRQLGADFDGDECSTFMPMSIEPRTELEVLTSVEGNFFCAQASTTYMSVVQDGVLGMYMLTREYGEYGGLEFSKGVFMQMANSMPSFTFEKYHTTLAQTGRRDAYTLISMMLPTDFSYSEHGIVIEKGIMKSGHISKSHINGGTRSLLFVLGKYYAPTRAITFIDDVQFLAHAFMTFRGFTIGLSDCLPSFNDTDLDRILCEGLFTASMMDNSQLPETVRERYVSRALSQTTDIGMKLAKDTQNAHNHFVHMVTSGSKGAFFNIAQITTLLGQQNVRGARMVPQLSHGRTLVSYGPADQLSIDDRFESRGFVRHSFLSGLKPQEFFFHAMAGREGVIDTAMRTASSGYNQRKVIKFLEDVRVSYDGSVRNETGDILQQKYAYTGYDPKTTVCAPGDPEPTFCDIRYLINQARKT